VARHLVVFNRLQNRPLDSLEKSLRSYPGGATGLLVRGYKGQESRSAGERIDLGVVSLFAELRGHERQAAEELERWKTRVGESKPLDASPAAITLTELLTDEELDSLEKRAGDGETARRGQPGGSACRKPSTGCAPW
jgi:hypothetical protein